MPFDPTLPKAGTKMRSGEIRGNFNTLKEQIDGTLVGPAGPQGDPGPGGSQGDPGAQGDPGPTGPPFASAVVDGVTKLEPGEAATVSTSFDGTNVHFSFGIPRGQEGPMGQPGEVSQAALDAAIAAATANSSANSNAVDLIDTSGFSDPPTLANLLTVANKLNELITTQRR